MAEAAEQDTLRAAAAVPRARRAVPPPPTTRWRRRRARRRRWRAPPARPPRPSVLRVPSLSPATRRQPPAAARCATGVHPRPRAAKGPPPPAAVPSLLAALGRLAGADGRAATAAAAAGAVDCSSNRSTTARWTARPLAPPARCRRRRRLWSRLGVEQGPLDGAALVEAVEPLVALIKSSADPDEVGAAAAAVAAISAAHLPAAQAAARAGIAPSLAKRLDGAAAVDCASALGALVGGWDRLARDARGGRTPQARAMLRHRRRRRHRHRRPAD